MIGYRLATEKDYKNINDFHNRIYRSDRTIEQFYWEFHNAPAGPSIYIIAEDGDKVIGTQCAIPIYLITSSGEKIYSGKSEDTLVDPEYRGQNIFNKLYEILFSECSAKGIKVIWGFTSAIKPFIKMGFDTPFEHKQVLAVNKINYGYKYLASLNKKNRYLDMFKIFGLCCMSKTKYMFNFRKKTIHNTVSTGNITELEGLLSSNLQAYQNSFAIEQTKEYQKWRIYENPNYHKLYTFSFSNSENKLAGVITVNVQKDRVAFIIQSLFDHNLNDGVKSKFIRYVSSCLFSEGVTIIRNWIFDHNQFNKDEIGYYLQAGYYKVDKGVSLVWKKLDDFNLSADGFFLSRITTQGVM